MIQIEGVEAPQLVQNLREFEGLAGGGEGRAWSQIYTRDRVRFLALGEPGAQACERRLPRCGCF